MKKKSLNYDCLLYRREDIFSNLYDYISQIDPKWEKELLPASDDEIEYLIRMSRIKNNNHKLPEVYIKYLKLMGNYDGCLIADRKWVNVMYLCFACRYMEKYYINEKQKTYLVVNEEEYLDKKCGDYFAITIDGMDEQLSAFYIPSYTPLTFYIKDVIRFIDEENYYIASDKRRYLPTATCFESYLMSKAVWKFQKNNYEDYFFSYKDSFYYDYDFDENDLNDVRKFLSSIKKYYIGLGFQEAWFCDDYTFLGIKDDLIIHVFYYDKFKVYIYGDDKCIVENIGKECVKKYDFIDW